MGPTATEGFAMPSPFPGMNPYLEKAALWPDFHSRFIAAIAETLTARLLPKYVARIEQYLYIHDLAGEERQSFSRPDVSIHPSVVTADLSLGGAVSVAPSVIGLPAAVDVERLPYLEIRDRNSRTVVTAVELLSPANKYAGPDRDQYLEKQTRLLRSYTNLVELDLLRGGPRMPWVRLPACAYYAIVSRADDRSRADCWPVPLRGRLPQIPIPLRPGEPEPTIDLQGLLDRVYDGAGYEADVYAHPPEPLLPPADAAWAAGLVPTSPG